MWMSDERNLITEHKNDFVATKEENLEADSLEKKYCTGCALEVDPEEYWR